MEESFIPIDDSSANSLFKFDKRILLITIKRKIIFIFIVSFVTFMLFGIYAKITRQEKWTATAMMVKYDKHMASSRDIPYLYQDMNANTIMESFYRRTNLEETIDSLGLAISSQDLHGLVWIKRGNRANTYQVSAQHYDRELAVDLANTYCDIFIRNYNKMVNEPVYRTYSYFKKQLVIYNKDLVKVQKEIRQFQNDYNITSIDSEISRKNTLLNNIEMNILDSRINVNNLEAKIVEVDSKLPLYPDIQVPLGYWVDSPIDTRIYNKEKEIETKLKIYTNENPKIKKLYSELVQLNEEKRESDKGQVVPTRINYGNDPIRYNLLLLRSEFETDLSGERKNLISYQEQIEDTKASVRYLSGLSDEFQILKNEEQSIRGRLSVTENRMIETKIAMDSNTSDFEVIDKAIPPRYPEATQAKVIAMLGGILAFLGLTIFYLMREFLDDTVKSDFDFDQTFNIKLLGEIPNKDSFALETYWSQIQIVFGQINTLLRGKRQSFISIGSDRSGTGKSFLIREFHDLYISRNKKVLWIETIEESDVEIEPYIINKNLYKNEAFDPAKNVYELSKDQFKCYFLRDENSFVRVLDKPNLLDFIGTLKDFDVIIWELFEVPYNMQLFSTISSVSDLLVMITRFRYSNKENCTTIIDFLKENLDIEVTGVLNDVQNPYFQASF